MRTILFFQLIEILLDIDPNNDECVIFKHAERYYRIQDPEAGKANYAHHISWRKYNRRPPLIGLQEDGNFWVIAHKCDVKGCVNPRHLENITTSQNNKDAYARGLVDLDKKRRSVRESYQRMDPEKKKLRNHRISLARHRYERNKAKKVMLDAAKVWGVKERLNSVMDVIEQMEKKS